MLNLHLYSFIFPIDGTTSSSPDSASHRSTRSCLPLPCTDNTIHSDDAIGPSVIIETTITATNTRTSGQREWKGERE